MNVIIVLVATAFTLGASELIRQDEKLNSSCVININDEDFPNPEPLFLRSENNNDVLALGENFFLPEPKTGLLKFDFGEKVLVACPGSEVAALNETTEEAEVYCLGGKTFELCIKNETIHSSQNSSFSEFELRNENETTYSCQNLTFSDLKCKAQPTTVAMRTDACHNENTGINLGYGAGGTIYPLIYICFNEKKLETLYSLHLISAGLSNHLLYRKTGNFLKGDIYDSQEADVNFWFTFQNQFNTFYELLDDEELARTYLKDHNLYYLTRGQLAPSQDFVFGSHGLASFYYVNAAPQWGILNADIWSVLEASIRKYSIKKRVDLTIYTGTLGTLKYGDIHGNLVDMHLGFSPKLQKPAQRIPRYFWKVVYNTNSKQGIVFLGVNNPYVKENFTACPNVLSKINWVLLQKPGKFLFACALGTKSGIIGKLPIPELDVTGGLLY